MSTASAIVISAILATFGWLYNSRQDRIFNRRLHTYNVLERLNDDEKLNTRFSEVNKYARENIADLPFADIDDSVDGSLSYIFDHFEFVSASVWRGDIDEVLVKECERSRFVKLYEKFHLFIHKVRKDCQQPTMWENYSRLALRWKHGMLYPLQGIGEAIMRRPSLADRYGALDIPCLDKGKY